MRAVTSCMVLRDLPIVCCALFIALGAPVHATQHLISPGDDWQKLNGRLKPGDEVILMPGRHKSATLDDLHGTAESPIVIRGLGGNSPSIIHNQRDGLRFYRPQHVIVKDLTISECMLGGVSVSAGAQQTASENQPESAQSWGPITIRNVSVLRTGLRNDRDAMHMIEVNGVTIEGCTFEGWNSCGIELVGCHDATIDNCSFKSAEGFNPLSSIQVRAASQQVRIKRCRFESAGKRVIQVGGNSKIDHFSPRLLDNDKPATRAEASDVMIENCFIIDGHLPVSFINADNCAARNCTIVRPRGSVFAVLAEQADPRVLPGRAIAFGSNLVLWEAGQLQKLVEVGKAIPANAILLEENLWWSTQAPAEREKLGPLPGSANWPQTTNVDPRLDVHFKPQEAQAEVFGVDYRILPPKQP